MIDEKREIVFAGRFIQGFAVGIEVCPVKDVYLQIQLGIVEVIIYNSCIEEEA